MVRPIVLNLLVALLGSSLAIAQQAAQPSSLTINVNNLKKNEGKLVVEIYNNRADWLKKPFRKTVVAASEETKVISFDVPPGPYAISIYQDVNGNGALDQNFIGIPKEPIGFGNNYKPFGKPRYESALINYKPSAKPQEIKLFEAL